MENYYSEIGSVTPDNLFLDSNVPVQVKGVTLATGQGTLARGTVLGKNPVDGKFYKVDKALDPIIKRNIAIANNVFAASVENLETDTLKVYVGDENGELATITTDYTVDYSADTLTITPVKKAVVKKTLLITGSETKTAVLSAENLDTATPKVYVGDENGALATITTDYTVAYVANTLTITVVAEGSLVDATQCYIEINPTTPGSNGKLANQSYIYIEADNTNGGANVADCILTDAIDTGTEADVVAQAYISGQFNRKA